MKKEKSCGAILYSLRKNEPVFLLIKHKNGGHWDFPKGHVEEDESEEETAQREVYEETGINVKILKNFRETINYCPKKDVEKEVVFFLAKAKNTNVIKQEEEIESFAWLNFNDALKKITFETGKNILEKAYNNII